MRIVFDGVVDVVEAANAFKELSPNMVCGDNAHYFSKNHPGLIYSFYASRDVYGTPQDTSCTQFSDRRVEERRGP